MEQPLPSLHGPRGHRAGRTQQVMQEPKIAVVILQPSLSEVFFPLERSSVKILGCALKQNQEFTCPGLYFNYKASF